MIALCTTIHEIRTVSAVEVDAAIRALEHDKAINCQEFEWIVVYVVCDDADQPTVRLYAPVPENGLGRFATDHAIGTGGGEYTAPDPGSYCVSFRINGSDVYPAIVAEAVDASLDSDIKIFVKGYGDRPPS